MDPLGSAYYGSDIEITEPHATAAAISAPQVLEPYSSDEAYATEIIGLDESYSSAYIAEESSSTDKPAARPFLSSYYGDGDEETDTGISNSSTLAESYSSGINENETASEKPVHAAPVVDTSATKSKAAMVAITNFSEIFQQIREQEESESSYEMLYKLSHDFGFLAELYGRIIISEISLPVAQKSIKPVSLGGQAGGDKFIVSGILFKFASGDFSSQMYGNEENAQKIAAHELKGQNAFYLSGVPGLSYPLMAVIKYLGFCLIAVSLLPIGKDTLVYGSSDAGKTMHFDDPDVYESMKQVALKLNLKPHKSGVCAADSPDMWGPGDIEGHRGSDGRKYVLDFARVFPPECPMPNQMVEKGALFFKLLRGELVRQNPVPLSSDALVGWGRNDPNKAIHNREVYDATVRLRTKIIPAFAQKLSSEFEASVKDDSERSFATFARTIVHHVHAAGINVRHLGLVRAAVTNESLKCLLLSEMVIRLLKCKLNYKLRKLVTQSVGIANERCLAIAVQTLNLLVHTDDIDRVESFWKDKVKYLLEVKFEGGLTEEEKSDSYDLFESLKQISPVLGTLPSRFIAATGVALSADASALIGEAGFLQPVFVNGDVLGLTPVVNNLVIGDFSYACATFLKALRLISSGLDGNDQAKLSAHRLLQMVSTRLQRASQIGDHFAEKMILNPSMAPLFERIWSSCDVDQKTSDLLANVIDIAINLSAAQKSAALADGAQNHIAAEYIRAAKLMRRCGAHSNARAMVKRAVRLGVESEELALEYWKNECSVNSHGDAAHELEILLEKYPNSVKGHFNFVYRHLLWMRDIPPSAEQTASLLRSTSVVIKHNPEWLRRARIRDLIGQLCIASLLGLCDPAVWTSVEDGEAARRQLIEALAYNLINANNWRLSRCTLPETAWIELVTCIAALPSSAPFVVDLERSNVTDRAISILTQSHGGLITKLSLSDVGTAEAPLASFEFLRHMPNLASLDLSSAYLGGKALETLPSLLGQSLRHLRVDGVRGHWTPQLIQNCILQAPYLVLVGIPAGDKLEDDSTESSSVEASNAKRSELISLLRTEPTLAKFENLRILGFRGILNLPTSFFDEINPLLQSLPNLVVLDLLGSLMKGEACQQLVLLEHPSLLAVVTGGGGLLAYSGSASRRVEIAKVQNSVMVGFSPYVSLWKNPPTELQNFVNDAGLRWPVSSSSLSVNNQVPLFSANLPPSVAGGGFQALINNPLKLTQLSERAPHLQIGSNGASIILSFNSPLARLTFTSASTAIAVGNSSVNCQNITSNWTNLTPQRDTRGQLVCSVKKLPFGGILVEVEPRKCLTAWAAAYLYAANR